MENSETLVLNLSQTAYDRSKAALAVDRSFKEFGQTSVDSGKTVEQFFIDYDDLFYNIPAKGAINSHQYLVERSSAMYKGNETLTDIQPLLDEINELRNQTVEYQQTILELKIQLGLIDGITQEEYDSIKASSE